MTRQLGLFRIRNNIGAIGPYDSNDNLASETVQLDGGATATTSYTYNSFGEVLTVTDRLGHVTTNAYDTKGNLLSVTAPAPDANTPASVTQFTYDTKGELTQITDPLNRVTTLTYYPTGLIHTITDAQQHVTTSTISAETVPRWSMRCRTGRHSLMTPVTG